MHSTKRDIFHNPLTSAETVELHQQFLLVLGNILLALGFAILYALSSLASGVLIILGFIDSPMLSGWGAVALIWVLTAILAAVSLQGAAMVRRLGWRFDGVDVGTGEMGTLTFAWRLLHCAPDTEISKFAWRHACDLQAVNFLRAREGSLTALEFELLRKRAARKALA